MTLTPVRRYLFGLVGLLGMVAAVGWPALHSATRGARRAAIT